MQHIRNSFPRQLLTRQRLLVSALALGVLACQPVSANYSLPLDGCRSLALCNLQLDESSKTAYWEYAEYPSDTHGELGQLFRDHRGDGSL